MKTVYLLDDKEKNLIDTHRQNVQMYLERENKRKNCQHNWKYDGHSHNDDCYVCTICGKTEYR